MSAFAVAALLALACLAAALGNMAAFCIVCSSRVAGGERHLIWAGGLIIAGVTTGILANYL